MRELLRERELVRMRSALRSPYSSPPLHALRAIVCVRPLTDALKVADLRAGRLLAGPIIMSGRAFTQHCGAYFALFALTLQLALSFAHVHNHDLAALRFDHADVAEAVHSSSLQAVEQPPLRLADDDDRCQICFSTFLLSNSSLPQAPTNQGSLLFTELDRAFKQIFDQVFQPRHAAFRSRAPPIA